MLPRTVSNMTDVMRKGGAIAHASLAVPTRLFLCRTNVKNYVCCSRCSSMRGDNFARLRHMIEFAQIQGTPFPVDSQVRELSKVSPDLEDSNGQVSMETLLTTFPR